MRPWLRTKLPRSLAMPGMMSDEERLYLVWVTQTQCGDAGAVVDLGSWVGCSTACLAEGLRRRRAPAVVHAFDAFRWLPGYMAHPHPRLRSLGPGEDFQPVFAHFTRRWARWIRAEKADLNEVRWGGGPIEILFVDAAKSWKLHRAILSCFGPHLIPEVSRVILQDFRHPQTFWLPLTFDSDPETWREQESVRQGTTVTFVPRRRLPSGDPSLLRGVEHFRAEDASRICSARLANAESPAERRRWLRMGLRAAVAFRDEAEIGRFRERLVGELGREQTDLRLREAEEWHRVDLVAGFDDAIQRGELERADDFLADMQRWFPDRESTAIRARRRARQQQAERAARPEGS